MVNKQHLASRSSLLKTKHLLLARPSRATRHSPEGSSKQRRARFLAVVRRLIPAQAASISNPQPLASFQAPGRPLWLTSSPLHSFQGETPQLRVVLPPPTGKLNSLVPQRKVALTRCSLNSSNRMGSTPILISTRSSSPRTVHPSQAYPKWSLTVPKTLTCNSTRSEPTHGSIRSQPR